MGLSYDLIANYLCPRFSFFDLGALFYRKDFSFKELMIKDRYVIMTEIYLLRDGMTHWMTIGKRIKLYIMNG
jgi:hypothetical protein